MRVRHLTRHAYAMFAVAIGSTGLSAAVATAAPARTKGHGASARTGRAHRRAGAVSGGAGYGFVTASTLAPATSAPVPASGPASGPVAPGWTAKIVNGVAYAPSFAPIQVQRAIWAGDAIRLKPYKYGGGHAVWSDTGYDCSGSVSYLLHAAGLIKVSMDSSDFMSWGQSGVGQWITVYTNPGHAFVEIAGIRLDTSSEGDSHPAPGSGPRWRPLMTDTGGYMARHPANF